MSWNYPSRKRSLFPVCEVYPLQAGPQTGSPRGSVAEYCFPFKSFPYTAILSQLKMLT
jgi:hypothetical protein